jgi:hypothetical protein
MHDRRSSKERGPVNSAPQLLERNLRALARYAPNVHDKINTLKPTETNLVFVSDGQADIAIGDQLLYGGVSKRLLTQPNLNAEWMKLAEEAVSVCSDPLRDKLVLALSDYTAKQGIGQATAPGLPYFHALVVGIGLGLHIPAIVRASGCRSLILVEPNAEFFLHSLSVTDWASLIEWFERIGGSIDFIIGEGGPQSGLKAAGAIAHYGYAFVDGALCFLHYRAEATQIVSETARKALDQPNGFGWFDDEMTMIINTATNLKQHDWHSYKRPAKMHEAMPPVFIVGAGPSFDKALETIRTYSGQAFIGSCGTALGQLLANGICPDFHFEIENENITFKVLEKIASSYDLGSITLVGPSVLDPGVAPLFKQRVFFFRPNLSVNPLFNTLGADVALVMPHPNAANVALSFFQEIGCREFYFFGIDLGALDPNRHHSKFSPYMSEGRDAYMKDMKLDNGWKFNIAAPANFGGTAYSYDIGLLAKANLAASIQHFGLARRYFNCGDGLLIEGAAPTKPEAVCLSAGTPDKHEAKRRVLAGFLPYKREEFVKAWRRDDWVKRASVRVAEFRQALTPRETDSPGINLARLLGEMPTRLSEGRGTVEDHVFCGTLALAARAAYKAISRADPPSRRAEVEEFARQEILRILDHMESRYHEVLTQASQLVD